jgi:hypothetical protein
LSTITAIPTEELGFLCNGLLWEMSERGFTIVDRTKLQTVFSPLVVASKEKFQEEMHLHRALIATRFGEDPRSAFQEVNELEIPVFVHSYYVQKSLDLEQELKKEKKTIEKLSEIATLTKKEKKEFELLKAKEAQRKKRAESKKRSSVSNPRRKKKKK